MTGSKSLAELFKKLSLHITISIVSRPVCSCTSTGWQLVPRRRRGPPIAEPSAYTEQFITMHASVAPKFGPACVSASPPPMQRREHRRPVERQIVPGAPATRSQDRSWVAGKSLRVPAARDSSMRLIIARPSSCLAGALLCWRACARREGAVRRVLWVTPLVFPTVECSSVPPRHASLARRQWFAQWKFRALCGRACVCGAWAYKTRGSGTMSCPGGKGIFCLSQQFCKL